MNSLSPSIAGVCLYDQRPRQAVSHYTLVRRRTFTSRPFQQCSEECVILEAKFRGESKSVLFKADLTQTEIHRTVVRLQTNSLFALFMFRLLQISEASEHTTEKKKEQTVGDLVSIFVGGSTS